jgi:alkylation response protein AidB-like acyl-CoA dehydrogenase
MHSSSSTGYTADHLEPATVDIGIARATLDDAADFFRTRAVAPPGVGIERAADDPHVILRFGQLQARLHAAEGLLARARRSADAVTAVEARAFAADLVAEIVSQVVAWGSPVRPRDNTSPADGDKRVYNANHWNYHYAGNYYLKGAEQGS